VISVEKKSGRLEWLREVTCRPKVDDFREINSRATPTIAAAPGVLIAYFGSAGLFAIDFSGRIKWRVDDVEFKSLYGVGHSPVVEDDVVVVANDEERLGSRHTPRSQIAAYSVSDGRLLWQRDRLRSECGFGAFSTPIIRTIGGRKTVVVRGWEDLIGYDLHTGRVQWSCRLKYRGNHLVASMVVDENRIYLVDVLGVTALELRSLETGCLKVAWTVPLSGEKAASPVLSDGYLFAVTETGLAACINAETGELMWKHRFSGRFFGSVVTVGKHVLFTSESGVMSVAVGSPTFRLAAQKAFDERIYATPTPRPEGILVRTAGNLYCLGADRPAI
jgi:outer membrane protein assembly factor BamB